MFTLERTGGNCTADVARIIDARTGQEFALVVTADWRAPSTLTRRPSTVWAGLYRAESWWGDDEDRDPVVEHVEIDRLRVWATVALSGLLASAGIDTGDCDAHGASATVAAIGAALEAL